MLMSVIRFLLPSSDHAIKKLLLIYWEIVPKRDSNGEFENKSKLTILTQTIHIDYSDLINT